MAIMMLEHEFDYYLSFVAERQGSIISAHVDLGISIPDCIVSAIRQAERLKVADPRQMEMVITSTPAERMVTRGPKSKK